ncbi:MAG TPA: hypothetical protein VFM18_18515 [Methanosarcina sp.]|nr:hypothetical protein [Methanosarcina sp.]
MKVWPKYFPTIEIANQYAHNQQGIANRAYANRMGNGNEASGDGWKYCGRGLIQITGRDNYTMFAKSINMSLDDAPGYLETFDGAVHSACWYWDTHHLNTFADSSDVKAMTKAINGGLIGLDDRIGNIRRALVILNS